MPYDIPSRSSDSGPEPEVLDVYDCIEEARTELEHAQFNRASERDLHMYLDNAEKWIANARERIGK